jgi:hypothetical protein
VNLVYQNSAEQQKDRILKEHSEIQAFISKLERKIMGNPEKGLPESIMSADSRSIPCHKQAVALNFFSERYALGYNGLAAVYIYNDKSIAILYLYYTS